MKFLFLMILQHLHSKVLSVEEFGGSGVMNEYELLTQDIAWHNQGQSIEIKIPPLATIYLKHKN